MKGQTGTFLPGLNRKAGIGDQNPAVAGQDQDAQGSVPGSVPGSEQDAQGSDDSGGDDVIDAEFEVKE